MAEAARIQVVDRVVEVAGDARDELGRPDRHRDVVEEQDQAATLTSVSAIAPVIAKRGDERRAFVRSANGPQDEDTVDKGVGECHQGDPAGHVAHEQRREARPELRRCQDEGDDRDRSIDADDRDHRGGDRRQAAPARRQPRPSRGTPFGRPATSPGRAGPGPAARRPQTMSPGDEPEARPEHQPAVTMVRDHREIPYGVWCSPNTGRRQLCLSRGTGPPTALALQGLPRLDTRRSAEGPHTGPYVEPMTAIQAIWVVVIGSRPRETWRASGTVRGARSAGGGGA